METQDTGAQATTIFLVARFARTAVIKFSHRAMYAQLRRRSEELTRSAKGEVYSYTTIYEAPRL